MKSKKRIVEILKEIVTHNEQQVNLVDGDQGAAEDLYTFEYEGTAIYNPFYDESLRFEVHPMEYYGEELITKFVLDYEETR